MKVLGHSMFGDKPLTEVLQLRKRRSRCNCMWMNRNWRGNEGCCPFLKSRSGPRVHIGPERNLQKPRKALSSFRIQAVYTDTPVLEYSEDWRVFVCWGRRHLVFGLSVIETVYIASKSIGWAARRWAILSWRSEVRNSDVGLILT